MKHIILGILFLANCAFLRIPNHPDKNELQLVIKDIKQHSGKIMIAVYNQEETYLDVIYKAITSPVDADVLNINIPDLPAGFYVISIFHDVNDNNELDTNFIGIPKEPFGFSNNVLGKFGPPSFSKAKVEVGPDKKTIVIDLR
ncbi:MAG: DUF2141 domain-containing protein [Flammeovirgaceae bacterium]|nr:DUF2141 domain-containing protein [Flammeovirgaceae bacterium]